MEKIGFSLFRREFSAAYMRNTPDIPASALERMSEDKWKALTDEQRQEFKERAKRQGLGDSLFVYHCQWADCQHQYEVVQDLMIHVVEGQHLSRCRKFCYIMFDYVFLSFKTPFRKSPRKLS